MMDADESAERHSDHRAYFPTHLPRRCASTAGSRQDAKAQGKLERFFASPRLGVKTGCEIGEKALNGVSNSWLAISQQLLHDVFMARNRFAKFTTDERALLLKALLFCVESNSGIGFRSHDQAHPDYHDGATGTTPPHNADSPDTNDLFQMIRELSLRLADDTRPTIYRRIGVTTWEHFCKKATDAATRHMQQS